ncbi:MAG: glycosyltransferase [Gammaproteobacteria bacterium]|nr:glycosyltransferase [Gammaproteobacteria bacterium]MBU1554768.1 glycosyltransferase [Gammaproteobacteria bacterium]MBU2069667.1 glycosyltransferase [Gammaproteobacteria bacterium]MBU2184532.1 glycosyltransferase [Gammaproteobacteria bacterium]MBU2205214.1 glycosyltransferase [Gammaproteobacteria bacterium]
MKSLCFVHQGKAQLPEIRAYCDYFSGRYQVSVANSVADLHRYDIIWFFMGCYRYRPLPHQFMVHEYASLSTPPFARLKDQVKQWCNSTPQLRVFQNPQQSEQLSFNDNIPQRYRDMGIAGHFSAEPDCEKRCDLIYTGTMDKSRQLHIALDLLLELNPLASIWLVGQPSAYLQRRYKSYTNVRFLGSVENSQIPELLSQARFGLNFIPDVYPYQLQTSTKLLEYAACGLPVIGNKTAWLKQFLLDQPLAYHDIFELRSWPTAQQINLTEQTLNSWHWQNRIVNAGFETILPE